jgi:hypothetical protein
VMKLILTFALHSQVSYFRDVVQGLVSKVHRFRGNRTWHLDLVPPLFTKATGYFKLHVQAATAPAPHGMEPSWEELHGNNNWEGAL